MFAVGNMVSGLRDLGVAVHVVGRLILHDWREREPTTRARAVTHGARHRTLPLGASICT